MFFVRFRSAFRHSIVSIFIPCLFQIRISIDVFREKERQNNIEDHITAGLMFIGPVVNPIIYVAVNRLYRQQITWSVYRVVRWCCPPVARCWRFSDYAVESPTVSDIGGSMKRQVSQQVGYNRVAQSNGSIRTISSTV